MRLTSGITILLALAFTTSVTFAQSANDADTGEGASPPAATLEQRMSPERVTAPDNASKVDLAFGAFQRGWYLTAFNLALPRAQDGDAAAQTLIAELYDNGFGIPRDTKEAANWYKIAANSGNREAQFSYAKKLLEGRDVEKDVEEAARLMKQAADAGHSLAMLNYANFEVEKRPTGATYRRVMPLYKKAAERGVSDASYAMARIHKSGLANGINDVETARKWLRRAALSGHETAQVELAIDLLKSGNDKDKARAFAWFSLSANRGNVIAQNRLSHMLFNGIGTELNLQEAAKWHIIARRAGRNDLALDSYLRDLSPEVRQRAIELANKWPIGRQS